MRKGRIFLTSVLVNLTSLLTCCGCVAGVGFGVWGGPGSALGSLVGVFLWLTRTLCHTQTRSLSLADPPSVTYTSPLLYTRSLKHPLSATYPPLPHTSPFCYTHLLGGGCGCAMCCPMKPRLGRRPPIATNRLGGGGSAGGGQAPRCCDLINSYMVLAS